MIVKPEEYNVHYLYYRKRMETTQAVLVPGNLSDHQVYCHYVEYPVRSLFFNNEKLPSGVASCAGLYFISLMYCSPVTLPVCSVGTGRSLVNPKSL